MSKPIDFDHAAHVTSKWTHALLIAAISTVPVILILLAMGNGPGISPDSVSYASAAQSLSAGEGFLDFTGEQQATYAPGLSLHYAGLLALGVPLDIAVVATNILALIATTALVYLIAAGVGLSRYLVIASTVLTVWNRTTVEVFSMLWSEVLFVPVTLAAVLLLVTAWSRRSLSWAIATSVALLLSVGVSLRYAGAFFALGVTLASLTIPRPRWRTKILQTGLLGVVPAVTLLIVAFINVINGSDPFGDRYPSQRSLIGALESMLDGLGTTLVWRGSIGVTIVIGTAALILALVGTWIAVVNRQATQVLAVTAFVYLGALLWSQSDPRLAHGAERLGYPAWPLIVIITISIVPILITTTRRQLAMRWAQQQRLSKFGPPAAITFVVVSIALLGSLNAYRYATDGRENGIGYARLDVKSTEAAALIVDIPTNAVITSNEPWLVAWLRPDVTSIPLPPSAQEWPEARIKKDVARIRTYLETGSIIYGLSIPESHASWSIDDFRTNGIEVEQLTQDTATESPEAFILRLP